MISANIPNALRKRVYRRDCFRCVLCDCDRTIQIHHCVPRGQGGTDSIQNLVTLCAYCHAHVHGHPLYATDVTPLEMEHMIVEYLADFYAPRWNPWGK